MRKIMQKEHAGITEKTCQGTGDGPETALWPIWLAHAMLSSALLRMKLVPLTRHVRAYTGP